MLEIFTAEFWAQYGKLLIDGTVDTLVMVIISTLFAYLLGLPMGVALVTHQGKILVQQRDAALLRGLWVFLLLENDDTPEGLEKKLRSMGIEAALQSDLGEAKHVFTHRIWNMKIYHFEASDVRKKPGYQFVTADELSALPMPTAVKVARKWAMELLK